MKKNLLLLTIGVFSIFYLQYTFSKRGSSVSPEAKELYKKIHFGRNRTLKKLLKFEKYAKVINEKSKRTGKTPLIYAVMRKKKGTVKALLENDTIKIDIANKAGETPLFLAAKKGLSDIVEILIEHGAKVTDNIIQVANNTEIKTLLKNAQQKQNQETPEVQVERQELTTQTQSTIDKAAKRHEKLLEKAETVRGLTIIAP